MKLSDEIYVTDQDNVTQALVSSHLYVDKVILHEIEKMEYLENHNNFNVNISFLENYVKKDNNNITNENFDVFVNNVRNCNDLFLLLMIVGDKKGCFKATFCVISKSQFTAILRVLCQNCIDLVIRNEL